ncbi:GntR family transcriptional regulator [Actinomadura kijaniata]|uniref:DNA-binding GntR family transcriptional regulator n=1 Tax=Actinomadura namibiensis TaxID=182080 RepID=A0A7W3LPT3_ACTNM|nr:GntR family transcriptional regulator [Actinomadura namibiensis]MBA8952058.1 DNA-binding GntR family transcriptional regulator [Actinomadura namibiensis]
MTAQQEWISRIEAASHDLGRSSTAIRVADLLRGEIASGRLEPGDRLPEDKLCAAARVSRNTMREAFRLLAMEGLVVHEFNRGVFVRRLTVEDLVDVYRMRRILECAGVQNAAAAGPVAVARVVEAVEQGERAAATGDWASVGTADIAFHGALGALCRSPRVDDTMRRILAELRLVFHVMGSPREFHKPYLHRNRMIADLLWRGDREAAERELRSYLDDAEAQLTAAYRALT